LALKLPHWLSGRFVWLERVVASEPAAAPRANPYHAVAIVAGRSGCGAVQSLAGQRFLSRKAPSLPLPGCDAIECRCRYLHYDDRRSGVDRRAQDLWNPYAENQSMNRRQARGRRSTDGR
jgi:hypothetical protein